MLPQVLPMLAVAAEPFDSPEYGFEIKYDGVRALAAVDEMGWRLWGRERADYTVRYPELDVLTPVDEAANEQSCQQSHAPSSERHAKQDQRGYKQPGVLGD
jgi:ATP-dependent DNA ligase